MLTRIKKWFAEVLSLFIDSMRKAMTLVTFFAFAVLIGLFFYFLYKEEPIMSISCAVGVIAFVKLNEKL